MNSIVEVRFFLSTLASRDPAARLPPELFRLASGVVHGDREAARDLVGDLLLDLLKRRGQAGSAERLLELDDLELRAALRRRLVQVRAANLGSKSRLMKALRAHVATSLEADLPVVDALPLTLVVGERLNGQLVREATAFLLTGPDAPLREPRGLAAELLALYFTARTDDVRAALHGEAAAGDEVEVLRRVDTAKHADQLGQQLGQELARVVSRRAGGMSLVQAGGGTAASTVHDQLGRAVELVREHAERHGLVAEDLEPVLAALAA